MKACPVGCPTEAYPTNSWRCKHRRRGIPPCESSKLCRQMHERSFRKVLADEQNWLCPLCGLPLPHQLVGNTHVDHIIPKSKGGTNDPDNLQTVHSRCNIAKGDLTIEEQKLLHWWGKRIRLPRQKE